MEVKDFFTEEQIQFYKDALELLRKHEVPYLIGGAFAIRHYTGVARNTKDIDIFCKAGDNQHVLKLFAENGFKVEVTDARWISKIFKEEYFIDLIYNTPNNLCPVDETWFDHAMEATLFDVPIHCVSPEELIWCKLYIQDRGRYDGADINHMILKQGKTLDWDRLLMRVEQHWHLLLAHLLNFQFVYPSEREIIPRSVFYELLHRAKDQFDIPPSKIKVCRGPIIDHSSYEIDIKEWNFKAITLNTV